MTRRFLALTVTAFGAATLASCAFVLDFPEDVKGAGGTGTTGGAGPGGAGGAGGAGGSDGCPSRVSAPEPVLPLLFAPESTSQGTFIGGLARQAGTTFIHGSFGGQLQGFPSQFPENSSVITFMARLADGAAKPEILGSASTCLPTCGFLATFGVTMMGEHPVGAGFIPSISSNDSCVADFVATEVHFDVAGLGSACGVGNGFIPMTDPDVPTGSRIPYIARYRGVEAPDVAFSEGAQAQPLAIATVGGEVVVLGLSYGSVWGWDPGSEFEYRHHLVRFEAATFAPATVEFIDGTPDVTYFEQLGGSEVPGALTVDDAGTVWATGAHCPAGQRFCLEERSYFVSRWPSGSVVTQAIPRDSANESSYGSAIAFAHDRLVIGGGYSASITNTDLPVATEYDPFVIAVSRDDPGTTLWSWPSADSQLDRSRYEAVFDLAVVAPEGCGARGVVYVAGCTMGPGATVRSCQRAYGDADKQAFLVKLDLETGEEIAVSTFAPSNPATEMFLPTALAADESGVYVAFNLLGSATLPVIGQISGAAPNVEGKLIRFTP